MTSDDVAAGGSVDSHVVAAGSDAGRHSARTSSDVCSCSVTSAGGGHVGSPPTVATSCGKNQI